MPLPTTKADADRLLASIAALNAVTLVEINRTVTTMWPGPARPFEPVLIYHPLVPTGAAGA